MAAAAKDTLYIDIEDEITAVIEKVVSSKHKIVALVLPKHAGVFQSVVNMKLLKKAAASAHKSLVLITSDKAVLAIAGSAGVHVAKTLSTKPEIPSAAALSTEPEPQIEASVGEAPDEPTEKAIEDPDADSDTIELDNTTEPEPTTAAGKLKSKSKKMMRIPDFSKFSVRMGLGLTALVLLIVFWIVGFVVLPKATVTVNTDTMTNAVNAQATARVGLQELDLENNVLPAERSQVEKTDEVTVPATGEKNIGKKATGKMNLTNCIKSEGVQVVPAGTRFSAGSITFVSTEQAILPEATFNVSGDCRSKDVGDDKTVDVEAIEAGETYNVGSQSYTSSISGVRASGSAMSGGTTQVIKVVSNEDVEAAKTQLSGASKAEALAELKGMLEELGVRPVDETLKEGTPKVDVSPAVDAEAAEVKVTMTVSYSLIGLAEEDIATLLDKEVKENLGDEQKNIRDNGLADVVFQLVDTPTEADTRLTIETVAKIGPEINTDALKEDIAGKRRGEIEDMIEDIEGVRSVSVEYSPAWITTTPKSADKIQIILNEEDDN